MNLTDLLAAAYDECGYASSPAAAVTTRITRNLNDGVRLVLSEPGMARIVDSDLPYQFTTVANTARYVVPDVVASIRKISERTNDRALNAMSLDQYRRREPDPVSVTGVPVAYVPIGRVGVATQPSDASAVFFKSTSASDTQTGFIEGIRTGGFHGRGGTVLTGTTAVQATANTDYLEITDLYLSTVAIGTVTLLEDSGVGTELARIPAGATRTHYYGFYLWPTPSAAVTYFVDYRRDIFDMAQTSDEPPLPPDFHQMLVDYAVMREYEIKNDAQRVLIAKQRFDKRLSRLKYQTQTGPDELPAANWRTRIGHSRLGGTFPADTWTRW